MMLLRRQFLQLTTARGSPAGFPVRHIAQTYPSRPVRVIVPFAPGGPNDILARLTAQKLSERLGKQFYVENIGGGGGNIGMGQASRAAADGHTMLVVPPNIVVNPHLFPSVPYDPFKDFDAVTVAVAAKIVLAVHPSMPVRNVKELVTLSDQTRQEQFASPGTGTPPHLVGEQFRLSLGLDLAHVPFNSGGLAIVRRLLGIRRSSSARCPQRYRISRRASCAPSR